MFFLLIGFLVILIILFIIIGLTKGKGEISEKEGETMFKHMYIYLVLFTMLLLSVGGGIGVFMGVADLINPTSNIQSFTDYKNMQIGISTKESQTNAVKTEKQLRQDYQEEIIFREAQAKNQAKSTIMKSIGFIIIPFPTFLYFNRMRKKKENE